MAIYWSNSHAARSPDGQERKGAFFDSAIHGDAIPDDAVEITPERHAELLDAQAAGAAIVAGKKGAPRARGLKPSTPARRAQLVAQVKAEARRRIEAIAPLWRQLNDTRQPSAAADRRFAAIDAVRDASGTIEDEIAKLKGDALATFSVAAHAAWPEIDE